MTVRQKLTESEMTLAVIIGGGLFLIILGLLRGAVIAGSPDANNFLDSALIGLGSAAMVLGFIAWLIVVRPWKNFDDWSKPLYTGHHDDHAAHAPDQAATHGQEVATAEGAEQPDNLAAISGINTRIIRVLNIAGIYTFEQLAARRPADIERIVRDAGLRVPGGAARWVEQAKALAANKNVKHA